MITITDRRPRTTRRTNGKRIVLPFPLPRTHCGFPLGNGNFGALVWGESNLHITINRADYWDHRDGDRIVGHRVYEQITSLFDPNDPSRIDSAFIQPTDPRHGDFTNTRLPVGRFDLSFHQGLTPQSGILDTERGELTINLGSMDGRPKTLILSIHPTWPVLLIRDAHDAVDQVFCRPAWQWVSKAFESRDYLPPSVHSKPGEQGWVQSCAAPGVPALACLCRRVGDDLIITAAMEDNAETARDAALRQIDQVHTIGTTRFTRQVRAWWRNYSRDLPQVDIPDPFFKQFLTLAQYKFGAATSPLSTTPAGLQGPWCEEYRMPPWSCDYHFNVNVQQIYTLAFSLGKTQHLLPLFDMLDRCLEHFRQQAKAIVDIDDGLLMSHAIDDRGMACGGLSPGSTIDHAVSGWTAQLYWLYYQHTGDIEFLRNRAMPFMKGVMRVYEAMLQWKNNRLTLPVSISAEYAHLLPDGQHQTCGRDPSYQLACIHMLATSLLEASEALGQEPSPAWSTIRHNLPPFTLVGRPDNQCIAIWQDQNLEISHRHHSHLACIYPFDTLGELTPETQRIIDNSLRHWLAIGMSDWSEWCIPWAAIIQARAGYRDGPYLLLKLCRDLFVNEGLATVYIPRFPGFTLHAIERFNLPLDQNEVMQLDGTMAMATALYEMLVHTHSRVTRFFPAVPTEWKDVAFQHIHLPGLIVSGQMERGTVSRIVFKSTRRGPVCIDVPGYSSMDLRRERRTERVSLPVSLTMNAGERIEGINLKRE